MSATVKQYNDLLEDMKKVYQYDEEKTEVDCLRGISSGIQRLEIRTVDEKTGVSIVMSKEFDLRDGE